ncbi:MAG: LuxR family transcriptional regulator [Variovorax sp.]|nr:MAG: LuxR family transcriptional regulator [Variovorax sp.]
MVLRPAPPARRSGFLGRRRGAAGPRAGLRGARHARRRRAPTQVRARRRPFGAGRLRRARRSRRMVRQAHHLALYALMENLNLNTEVERVNATALTLRQKDIALLSAKGLPNADVARRLNITPNTLKDYFKDIYARIEIKSHQQLVARLSADQPFALG